MVTEYPFLISPYHRTRATTLHILEGAGVTASTQGRVSVREDVLLREVEHGYEDVAEQEALRSIHDYFYYRMRGGESPADCYVRCASMLESMQRGLERRPAKGVIIVSHGLTIRCLVMRFMHLSVEQFSRIGNPANCDIITIVRVAHLIKQGITPQFTHKDWGVTGLHLRTDNGDESHQPDPRFWWLSPNGTGVLVA